MISRILSISFLFSSVVCFGQYRDVTAQELANKPGKTLYEGVYRFSPPSISHCDITNPLKIGESKLHIEYDLLAVCDTTTGQQYKDIERSNYSYV